MYSPKIHHLFPVLFISCLMCLGPSPSSAAPPDQAAQAKAKENKVDQSADVQADRDVVQALEHAKKQLEAEKVKDPTGHRAAAVKYIQQAMGEIRSRTSKAGH
jgi:hypothetical protein